MKRNRFSIWQRLQSFQYAFAGLKILIEEEHNARIHLFAAIIVIIFGCYFHISPLEWMAVLICIGLVLATEAFNSAIENMADLVSPQKHPTIKKIKDLSAAAVLVVAFVAFLVGGLVFLPKVVGILFSHT